MAFSSQRRKREESHAQLTTQRAVSHFLSLIKPSSLSQLFYEKISGHNKGGGKKIYIEFLKF